jgi:hypothetical protein
MICCLYPARGFAGATCSRRLLRWFTWALVLVPRLVSATADGPWTQSLSATDATLRGIAYGISAYVAVGDGGTIVSSTDGMSWVRREAGTANGLRAITYGGDLFVAVGDGGIVLVSRNGESWEAATAGHLRLNAVAFGNARFLAVGEKGAVFSSADGRAWTECDSGVSDSSLRAISFAENPSHIPKFVIVGDRSTMLSTPDGGVFHNYGTGTYCGAFPTAIDLEGVVGMPAPAGSDASMFVALGEAGFITSVAEDGIADLGYEYWNPFLPVNAPSARRWRAIAGDYPRDEFVLVGDGGAVSTGKRDGYNFAAGPEEPTPTNADWYAVACGLDRAVAVGAMGAIISRPLLRSSKPAIRRLIEKGLAVEGTVVAGATRTFKLTTVSGTGTLSFQWYFLPQGMTTAQLIPGATTPTFSVVDATAADVGHYAVVVTDGTTTETSNLTPLWLRAPASEGGFSNVSVRGHTSPGSGTLSVGFVTFGPALRSAMVRAVGPGLDRFGITNRLGDPVLSVFDERGQRMVRAYDHDFSPPNYQWPYGAFPLPWGSRDAAIHFGTNGPRTLTAQATSANGATGIALLEVYGDGFANFSARGLVGATKALIAGVVVKTQTQQVLIRGIGPTLQSYGVTNAVNDPQIRVYDPDGRLTAENDDWPAGKAEGALLEQAVAKTGAFPLVRGSKDAALLLRFAPGEYTIEILNARGAEGVALIELYSIP